MGVLLFSCVLGSWEKVALLGCFGTYFGVTVLWTGDWLHGLGNGKRLDFKEA